MKKSDDFELDDRRDFDRIEVSREVLIYIDGSDYEIDGIVTDLSEENIGLKFKVTPEQADLVSKRRKLSFEFIDTYKDGRKQSTDVVIARVFIKRLDIKDGVCSVGGIVKDDDFQQYVLRRKIAELF